MKPTKHITRTALSLLVGFACASAAVADFVPGRGYALVEDWWGQGDFFIVEFDLATAVTTGSWLSDRIEDVEGISFATDWDGIPGTHLYGISASDHMVIMDPGPQQDIADLGGRQGDDAGLDVYNGTMYNLNGVRADTVVGRGTYLYSVHGPAGGYSLVGTMNGAFADNIAFAPDGTAYAMDWYYNSSLYTVDLGNGELSWVGSLGSVGNQHWAGSAFYNGTLYALLDNGHLYTVDTGTGAAAFVGQLREPSGAPWDHTAAGLAIYVPEPGAVLLLGLAALCLRRR